VRDLGIQPSEFWRMKPRHFWWMFSDAVERSRGGPKPKGLTKRDANALLNWMDRVNNGSAAA